MDAPDARTGARPLGPQERDPRRYHVMGEHGRGGLGRVQRAHDRELGRDVAIKELISRNEVHEVRFLREALITARLEHPGIVPVHEAGRWPDGTPFYAMKLVSGRSLRDLIAECTTSDERLGLLHHVIAVADAIAYAHGRNIIHRDLKPANVIVGEFGETIVIDWGLAKDLTASEEPIAPGEGSGSPSPDEELTVEGSVLGTPAYMAPEQGRGEAVDQRADVFAIGTMLWELCAARRMPPTSAEARHRILRRAGIDRDLITIIDNALAPDPEKRYPDAGALAADLKAFKSGARIAARSYTLWAVLAHWTRRNRTLALTVGAAVVVAAVLTVFYVRNIAVERDRADSALRVAQQERDRSRLSEASLVLDQDPNRAKSLLSTFAQRTPQVALLTSRANERSARHVIALPAGVDALSRAPGSDVVDAVIGGELQRLEPKTGTLTPQDRDLVGEITYRNGVPLYARQTAGGRSVRIATPSNINAMPAGALEKPVRLVALDDATYALDAADDLHLLDGKTAHVIEHGVHRIAGAGTVLLVCRNSGDLEIRRTGKPTIERRCAQTKSQAAMAVVGHHYAAMTDDGTLLIGDGDDLREVATDISGEYELALSARGVVGLVDYGPRGKPWVVRAGATRPEIGPQLQNQLWGVAADGDLVAWSFDDGRVFVFDAATDATIELHGHSSAVGYLVLDAANGRLVSGSRREIRIWDIKPPPTTLIRKLPCAPFNIEPSPDGTQVAADCNDGSVWVWSRATGVTASVQKQAVWSLHPTWLGDRLCTGALGDGEVKCSSADGANLEIIDTAERASAELHASKSHGLIIASLDGKIFRYQRTLQQLYDHNSRPERMAVSSDDRWLASCAQDGSIIVYDLASDRVFARRIAHPGGLSNVAWVGNELFSSGSDGTLKHWQLRDGDLTLVHVTQAPGPLRLTRRTPARWLAAAGAGTVVSGATEPVIDIALETGGNITALDSSRDDRYLAFGTKSEIIVVDVVRSAVATMVVSENLQAMRFVDGNLLVFGEPGALRSLRVDQLTYVPFQRMRDRGANPASF